MYLMMDIVVKVTVKVFFTLSIPCELYCKTTSLPRPIGQFQNNVTDIFFGWPSKIAKMVPLH